MFMPFGVAWRINQLYPMPVLEFSTSINKQFAIEEILLQLALSMIEDVEKYGGIIIQPSGSIPKDQNIFFVALFKSNKDIENFTKAMGMERMG